MYVYILSSVLGEPDILLLHIYSAPFVCGIVYGLDMLHASNNTGSIQLAPTKYLQLKFRPVI
jgi:hypothetical protein